MLRKIGLAAALATGLGGGAFAQVAPEAPSVSSPPQIVAPGALQSGANSFTENQARRRLEQAGFTNVTNLRKDEAGIWRGRASRGTAQVGVGVDFRGNVASE